MKTLRLEGEVFVKHLLPYHFPGRVEHCLVEWGSYWGDKIIEVGVGVVNKGNGRWKVVELEVPVDTPEEDLEAILSCSWYFFDQHSYNKKCPPIISAWEFDSPHGWVIACSKFADGKKVPFAVQLREMENGPDIEWVGENLIASLQHLGPGICTVATDIDVLEFDILKNGTFAERAFCPECADRATLETTEAGADIERELLELLTESRGAGVSVRTFLRETVHLKHGSDLVEVPVKELRGFVVRNFGRNFNHKVVLQCEKLSPQEVRDAYSHDYRTGKFLGLVADEREYRFV